MAVPTVAVLAAWSKVPRREKVDAATAQLPACIDRNAVVAGLWPPAYGSELGLLVLGRSA